jgi:hypothetical protein
MRVSRAADAAEYLIGIKMKQYRNGKLTAREYILARLARAIGRGHDAIYHGTRHPQEVLRGGKLKPDLITNKISLSRSPEVAAHFALLPDDGTVRWSPAVLVLNRSSLVQTYRLEPWHDGWDEEQEEVIWCRTVNFRRHLLGVVTGADVTKVLGTSKQSEPLGWRHPQSWTYHLEELKAGSKLVRGGRARVRNLIDRERKQRSAENARLPATKTAPGRTKKPRAAAAKSPPYKPSVKTRSIKSAPHRARRRPTA